MNTTEEILTDEGQHVDENNDANVSTEAEPVVAGSKPKTKKTGDVFLDTAHEVEGLSKTKALHLAKSLAEDNNSNDFKLGGVLKLIKESSWFDGYATFEEFLVEEYGFQYRKAQYLIGNYEALVEKQIPYEKVKELGWTKLKLIVPVLTLDNVDEWVAKAKTLNVVQLEAAVKAGKGIEGDTSVKTSDNIVKVKLNFHADQAEAYSKAVAKAKGELGTEHDTVAVENIMLSYLGGNTTISQNGDLAAQMKAAGFAVIAPILDELYGKEYNIEVTKINAEDAAE